MTYANSAPAWSPIVRTIAAMLLLFATSAAASERAAVVIGNEAYPGKPAFEPVNDARLIASLLRELNFDVMLVENVTGSGLQKLPKVSADHLAGASVKFVYYAGYVASS